MSAESNLAGFFSTDLNINWRSIPINVVPRKEDYALAAEKRCDHFDYLMVKYENTTAYSGLFEKNKSLIRYLEVNSGLKLRTITDINNLYDTLFIERLKQFR